MKRKSLTAATEDAAEYLTNGPTPDALEYAEQTRIINQAIDICESRLRKYGEEFVTPKASRDFFALKMSHLEVERFDVLFLNNRHRLIAHEAMFMGTVDSAAIYPREVAKRALQLNAIAVIFAHNHPSGSLEASEADITITESLKGALKLIGCRVLDHIIVGGTKTTSMAESGLL